MRTLNVRRSRLFGFGALVAIAAIFAASLPFFTTAHESRETSEYRIVVGFLSEPAVSNELNGLDLRVSTIPAEGEEAEPVVGLEATLQAEVIFGDQRRELTIEAAWNNPGRYEAVFIPTQPGDYSFRIWGTIDGEEIDEIFTAGPTTFSTVLDRTTLEFPAGGD